MARNERRARAAHAIGCLASTSKRASLPQVSRGPRARQPNSDMAPEASKRASAEAMRRPLERDGAEGPNLVPKATRRGGEARRPAEDALLGLVVRKGRRLAGGHYPILRLGLLGDLGVQRRHLLHLDLHQHDGACAACSPSARPSSGAATAPSRRLPPLRGRRRWHQGRKQLAEALRFVGRLLVLPH